MMLQATTIELFKEEMKFSAGHFTIFSSEKRENLHGHNFRLYVALTAEVNENGISSDYRLYKEKLRKLCETLNEKVLMPGLSPYLVILDAEKYWSIFFAEEEMRFLKRDILILPIKNITVEALSSWFMEQLLRDELSIHQDKIIAIKVKVFSGPGQSGATFWQRAVGNQLMVVGEDASEDSYISC